VPNRRIGCLIVAIGAARDEPHATRVLETARCWIVCSGPSSSRAIREEREGSVELAVGEVAQVSIAQYHDAH
jgi:hypothetical protein